MPRFEIDPDIRNARTLESRFYTDPGTFELSKERIFSRTWHFAGRADEVSGLKPITLLPGVLDEPLLLIRREGSVHCVSNVCTHRGKILVEEPCEASLIRCGYHGRRFSLDGKFLSMPEFEGVNDFPCEADDLRWVPLVEWNGFLFVAIDPVEPFEEFIHGAESRLNVQPAQSLALSTTREYTVDAHWALYAENYLEGFHIPYVHRSLNEIVDYGTYETETFRFSSLQTAYADDGAVAARYLFIFPNTMLNFYDWGVSVNVVRPVAPAKTAVEFLTYLREGAKIGEGAGGDLHGVEMEDEAVVGSVQRGIRSRFYSFGRYSPSREQGTHHFHRLIAEFIG